MSLYLSDRHVVLTAAAVLAGAWRAGPVPAGVLWVAVLGALLLRRAPAVVLAAALMASALGDRAWNGVHSAPVKGTVDERVRLVGDPRRMFGSVRCDMRLGDGRRVQGVADGDAASVLIGGLAGETVHVRGRLGPLRGRARTYLQRRHVGAMLTVDGAHDRRYGSPLSRYTNQLRRTLVDGAGSLDDQQRALFTGIVLGDDREQSPVEVDDFRASGLSHLLAVSGQNVAFVLVVASPLLRRIGRRARFVAAALVLVAFGVLTRWEPSVMRAVAMAGLTLLASTYGRPTSSVRVLALAVIGLVLVDPMLVGSVGFLLSVGACAGIAVVGPVLQARGVPALLAVTLAAQVGVAPVMLPVFGGIPLASVPANLLAAPAAGPLMVWGLVAGLPAGLIGGPVASLLHVPTRLLVEWIAGVARLAAALPLPEVGAIGAACVMGTAILLWLALGRRRLALVLVAVAVATSAIQATAVPSTEERGRSLVAGVRMWRRDGAVVVVAHGVADEGRLLTAMRRAGVRRVDILVLRSGGTGAARVTGVIRHRARVRSVLAPQRHSVPGALAATAGTRMRAGPLEVVVKDAGPRLDVGVTSASP